MDIANSDHERLLRLPGIHVSFANSDHEKPAHTVTLSDFFIGRYPVTQAQYKAVMRKNPSYFHGGLSFFQEGADRKPVDGEVQRNRPVECVSWYNAIVFCNRLSMAEGLTPAYRMSGSTNPADWGALPKDSNSKWDSVEIVSSSNGYRLPTEAQWEYAAKGGNGSPGNFMYAGSNRVDDVAWYRDNNREKTHEVGKKSPNGLGLYDMSGNVWEWCWDWYGVYSDAAQTNPTGAVSGISRIIRGGGWSYSAEGVRSTYRYNRDPSNGDGIFGFRLVRPEF